MKRIAAILVGLVLIVGCESEKPAPETPPTEMPAEETSIVRPMEEYRADAAEKIDPANAEQALDELIKEIDSDKSGQ